MLPGGGEASGRLEAAALPAKNPTCKKKKSSIGSPSACDLRDRVPHELEHLPGVDLVVGGVVAELPVPSCSEGEHASFLKVTGEPIQRGGA